MRLRDNRIAIEESMATLITIMSERMAFSHHSSYSECEVYKCDEWPSEVRTPTSQNHFKHAVQNPINKISPTTQLNRGPTPRAQKNPSFEI
jgi:hypothetical protein